MYLFNNRILKHIHTTVSSILLIVSVAIGFGAVANAHPGNVSSDGAHYCRTNCETYGYQYGERICHYPSDGCGDEGLTEDSYEGGTDSISADDTPDYSPEDVTPSVDDAPVASDASSAPVTPNTSIQDTAIPTQDTASRSNNTLIGAAVGATVIGGLALAQYVRKN
jgi:hypothetical protein